jgi:hypothetical protein
MAARCAHCGEALRPHSMFCLSCGQLVAQAAAPTPRSFDTNTATATPPPVAIAPPPAGPARAHVAVVSNRPTTFGLRFSTGVSIDLTDQVLVGRNPVSAAANEGILGLVVDDDERSVSRVHVHFQVIGDELWVTDRGSGNGTRIERGGRTIVCAGGTPTPAHAGDRIWVGSVYCNVLIDDSL